nr:glycosyltransferase family A protein [uncultured Prevotella sp.]
MISVVIPLYNKEASIKQSLMSVLSQSYQDFEVVIVDDGSTDNSVAKVEEIQDSRIRLIRQENGGPSKARNTGVKNAKGEWVLFLDADDELLPNALNVFKELLTEHKKANVIDCVQTVQLGKKNLE